MPGRLTGKVCVITGTGGSMGRAAALTFAREGARVVGCDMAVYQRYVDDIIANVKKALANIDPAPYFAKYGDNEWAAVKEYQAAQVAYASAPVIKKYTGVLGAADVYTAGTTFVILESVRLDLGVGSQVHA